MQWIKMKEPEKIKNLCVSTTHTMNIGRDKNKIYGNDWWLTMPLAVRYIDDNLVYHRDHICYNDMPKFINEINIYKKFNRIYFVNIDNITIINTVDIITDKSLDTSLIRNSLNEAIGLGYTKWEQVVDIANDIIEAECNGFMEDYMIKQWAPGEERIDIDKVPFDNMVTCKRLRTGSYPNSNPKYFDYVMIEFYIVAYVKDRKKFIKKHIQEFLMYCQNKIDNNHRIKKYNLSFKWFKLTKIVLTNDQCAIFSFDIKGIDNENL